MNPNYRNIKLEYGMLHNMPVFISFAEVGGGGGGGSIPDERKASSTFQDATKAEAITTYSGEITNHYTWQGRKLGKSLRNSQGTLTLDETYYDELMLNFGKPGRISHADGYVSLDENGEATFYYYLTDHLGNVRSVITPDTDGKPLVVQANDYFPFGMSFESPIPHLSYKSTTTNKHKYNGKEEQEMPGKWLDYGARFYDAQLGRFHTSDPFSEKFSFQSPFVYAANNPILYIDKNGEEPVTATVVVAAGVAALAVASVAYVAYYAATNPPPALNLSDFNQSLKSDINSILSYSPEYKEQQKREQKNRESLDRSQLEVAKSIQDHIGSPSPDGTPDPKRNPSTLGMIVVTTGLTATAIMDIVSDYLSNDNKDKNKENKGPVLKNNDSDSLVNENQDDLFWESSYSEER